MPIDFQIPERLAGYATTSANTGDPVSICHRELIGPDDSAHLQRQIDALHNALFSRIPNLLSPSLIDHLLVVIRPDLTCTAYINELRVMTQVKPAGKVEAGAPVYLSDIADVTSVNLGVEVPADCGIVLLRSFQWRRSLFFDFLPLIPDYVARDYDLGQLLASQALMLLGIPATNSEPSPAAQLSGETQLVRMERGLAQLKALLAQECREEARYQELLSQHPWMLGGTYVHVLRHQSFDDANIPDFTAIRCYDRCHDIIELKQPFLKLFRKDQQFAADFNDSWNQAERYLSFASRQRSYLMEQKSLRFENPRCLLLIGYRLSEPELRELRNKEANGRSITVFTYDHLVEQATHITSLMKLATQLLVSDSPSEPANSGLQLTWP